MRNISVGKSITSRKCKSSVNDNRGQPSSNRTGTGISRNGKRDTYGNKKMDDDSNSSIKSALDTTDSSRSCDESSDGGELAPRMKRGKQSNEFVVEMMLEMKEDMETWKDGLLEMKEDMKTWKEKFERLEAMCIRNQGDEVAGENLGRKTTTPLISVVTENGKGSFSDLSYSQNTIAYFKKKKKEIERRLKYVIVNEAFGHMKFLSDKPENSEVTSNVKEPSGAEKVVIKAINMEQIVVPKEMGMGDYMQNATKLVTKLYNGIRSQVQQELRKRWFGKLMTFLLFDDSAFTTFQL